MNTLALFSDALPSNAALPSYVIERRGTSSAPWTVVHRESGLTVSVERPYPGQEALPPIEVANFRSREEAEAAAMEIDWSAVDARAALPEWRLIARQVAERRTFDAAYQAALTAARSGEGPWPWERDGLLHRPSCRIAPTLGRTDPRACPVCGAGQP